MTLATLTREYRVKRMDYYYRATLVIAALWALYEATGGIRRRTNWGLLAGIAYSIAIWLIVIEGFIHGLR